MKPKVFYAPVSEAIDTLRKDGFKEDLQLQDDKVILRGEPRDVHEFEVLCIYRYEGITDPGDEAVVYGLQAKDGVKGVLVGGYGPTSEENYFDNSWRKLHR